MAAANSTSRSSCFPVCVVNLPTTWLPRRLPRFESKMSRHGLRKRSAKPCYRYAEESLAVVSLRSWKQKPPNSLLIQDKTFYNLGQSPEDDLLLQVQGMIAEYERAKIIERHRRGKRHAARAGAVHVLSGAPYGYRYVSKYAGGGQARSDIVPEEARVVRHVFDWIARDCLSIGEVCRRLTQAGEVTRTGKTAWDRSAVWGMLQNPAYRGHAAFGKTRQEPLRPRLRAQRGRPRQPRRAVATVDVPQEEWLPIPVPALVEPDVFAAVRAQLRDNHRNARQSRRGALYLLQGLVQCQQCGYAYYG